MSSEAVMKCILPKKVDVTEIRYIHFCLVVIKLRTPLQYFCRFSILLMAENIHLRGFTLRTRRESRWLYRTAQSWRRGESHCTACRPIFCHRFRQG